MVVLGYVQILLLLVLLASILVFRQSEDPLLVLALSFVFSCRSRALDLNLGSAGGTVKYLGESFFCPDEVLCGCWGCRSFRK